MYMIRSANNLFNPVVVKWEQYQLRIMFNYTPFHTSAWSFLLIIRQFHHTSIWNHLHLATPFYLMVMRSTPISQPWFAHNFSLEVRTKVLILTDGGEYCQQGFVGTSIWRFGLGCNTQQRSAFEKYVGTQGFRHVQAVLRRNTLCPVCGGLLLVASFH